MAIALFIGYYNTICNLMQVSKCQRLPDDCTVLKDNLMALLTYGFYRKIVDIFHSMFGDVFMSCRIH